MLLAKALRSRVDLIEGQNASIDLRRLRVSLMADLESGIGNFMGGTAGSALKDDFTFRLTNVSKWPVILGSLD